MMIFSKYQKCQVWPERREGKKCLNDHPESSKTIFTTFFPSQTLKNVGAAQRDIQNVVQRMYVAKCFNVGSSNIFHISPLVANSSGISADAVSGLLN